MSDNNKKHVMGSCKKMARLLPTVTLGRWQSELERILFICDAFEKQKTVIYFETTIG